MAKLYFYYAAMNAGKSTMLLQNNYNYLERGLVPLLFLPEVVAKGVSKITSRIGIEAPAVLFDRDFDFFDYVRGCLDVSGQYLHCIMVDEVQFLTRTQVEGLARAVDVFDIVVEAYGLRTDFQGELFEGSRCLLALADELVELKTVCHCGEKAIMNMRTDAGGNKLVLGPQVQIGGNDMYISTCRKHFMEGRTLPFFRVKHGEVKVD